MGPGGPEGGPGLDYVAHGFVFLATIITCRLYKLTLSDQTQVALQLSLSFRFGVNIFNWAAPATLLGGPK